MYKVWRLEMQFGACVYKFWYVANEASGLVWYWYSSSCIS